MAKKKKKKVVKSSLRPHANPGSIPNPKTFLQAHAAIAASPGNVYSTTGNGTPFVAKAYVASKGMHKGQKVITFTKVGNKTASAYAYQCCWGCKTNCYRTHVDCYTLAV